MNRGVSGTISRPPHFYARRSRQYRFTSIDFLLDLEFHPLVSCGALREFSQISTSAENRRAMFERRTLLKITSIAWAARVVISPLACMALWSLCSSSAEASCGDYVMLGGSHGHGMHSDSAHPASAPCRGPECQRRQPLPLPPELPLRIAPFDAWTDVGPSGGDFARLSVLLEQATLRLPPSIAARIDRPPKSAL